MEAKTLGWYDVPSITLLPLSEKDAEALKQMVDSEGWRVYMKIKEYDAKESAGKALDPFAKEEVRGISRQIHAACMFDLTLADRLNDALLNATPKERGEVPPPPASFSPQGVASSSLLKRIRAFVNGTVG